MKGSEKKILSRTVLHEIQQMVICLKIIYSCPCKHYISLGLLIDYHTYVSRHSNS